MFISGRIFTGQWDTGSFFFIKPWGQTVTVASVRRGLAIEVTALLPQPLDTGDGGALQRSGERLRIMGCCNLTESKNGVVRNEWFQTSSRPEMGYVHLIAVSMRRWSFRGPVMTSQETRGSLKYQVLSLGRHQFKVHAAC
jgi:hypothetical protein